MKIESLKLFSHKLFLSGITFVIGPRITHETSCNDEVSLIYSWLCMENLTKWCWNLSLHTSLEMHLMHS